MRPRRRNRFGMEVDRRVGARIARARLEAGVAQWQLASALGLTLGPAQHIERGRHGVGPSQLVTIARMTGKSISFFFADAPSFTEAVK